MGYDPHPRHQSTDRGLGKGSRPQRRLLPCPLRINEEFPFTNLVRIADQHRDRAVLSVHAALSAA